MDDAKLVLHVDQADRWPAVFNNLKNVTRDYPGAQVRVVANGAGVYAFVGQSDLVEHLGEAADTGVVFQVCATRSPSTILSSRPFQASLRLCLRA